MRGGRLSQNLEIKARCADLAEVRRRVEALGATRVARELQVDTYFVTRAGRLKLRESSLGRAELIPYRRPDAPGPRRSEYVVIPLPEPALTRALFSALLGVHRIVRKEREVFLWENVRIHLDRVDVLGTFLELEAVFDGSAEAEPAERRKLADLLAALGVGDADLVAVSYEGLADEERR